MTESEEQSRVFNILGVDVTDVTMNTALDILLAMLDDAAHKPHAVYFVNAHTLNLACDDIDFLRVLGRADRVFGEGTGVRWAARMLHGVRLMDNVNGTDLMPALFARGRHRGYRYFLLGNTPERIARAAQFTLRNFPGWTLAGCCQGYLQKPGEIGAAIQLIQKTNPHLLLVGMGNPIQEHWIDKHLHVLGASLCMGVGGLFDYWSGDLQRAPAWLRESGWEWLHLLIRQPRKFRRYVIGNPLFLARVGIQRLQMNREVL